MRDSAFAASRPVTTLVITPRPIHEAGQASEQDASQTAAQSTPRRRIDLAVRSP